AALAGRLAFTSSVVMKNVACAKSSSRVILHAADSQPAALATVAYLQERGFNIFVTTSDPSAPIPHKDVFDSVSVQVWSHAVRRWAPEGVDFIFNFEDGNDILEESIERLSARGIIVQIGDIYPCHLRPGQHFVSVGYDRLCSEAQNILEEAIRTTPRHIISCLSPPSVEVQADALEFGYFNAALHKGMAVLLDCKALPAKMTVLRPGRVKGSNAFNPRAAYVIIGGIGGLGVNIAKLRKGDVLSSLSIFKRAYYYLGIRRWQASSREKRSLITARDWCQDRRRRTGLPDKSKTKALFSNLPNVAGVFYVAVRLNDSLFLNLTTEDDWLKVYDVKVKGLRILLDTVDPKKLDFLVLTSSMATISGSPGQCNYAAAQTEMEAMGADIPNCITVTVPPLTDGGVFVRSMPTGNARSAALDKYKDLGISGYQLARRCVDAIWTLNSPAYNPVYIPTTNWKRVMEIAVPEYHQACMRHLLVKETRDGATSNGVKEQTILGACASVLSLDVDRVEDNIPLSTYGLDSLT
ncbi:hypothetical protein MPER_11115, partial [Moniliophthora perniciosa FA553]